MVKSSQSGQIAQTPSVIKPLETVESLKNLSLNRFCNKKCLEIVYVAESIESKKLFADFLVEAKKYQDISFVYFIKYEDVIDMVRESIGGVKTTDLPKNLLSQFEEICQKSFEFFDQKKAIPSSLMAELIKLRILQTLYATYRMEVLKMEKRKRLDEELKLLATAPPEKEAGKGKKGKAKDNKTKSDKSKKSDKNGGGKSSKGQAKEVPKVEIEDYSQIPLEENEIIFDLNLDNQVLICILTGFQDLNLFENLVKIQVPIAGILKFSLQNSQNPVEDRYHHQLDLLFEFPKKYLEDTIFMKFQTEEDQNLKDILEKFTYVLHQISHIRQQHLGFLKSLELYNFEPATKKLSAKCFVKYNQSLSNFPSECVSVVIILNALIEEVCWSLGEQDTETSELDTESCTCTESDVSCIYPLGIKKIFKPPKVQRNPLAKRPTPRTYQAHEDDILYIILNTYKCIGRKIYDTTLKLVKLTIPFRRLTNFEEPTTKMYHDQGAPSEDYFVDTIAPIADLIHLAKFLMMEKNNFVPDRSVPHKFSENLIVYSEEEQFIKYQFELRAKPSSLLTLKNPLSLIAHYSWKENLSQSVLLQLIAKNLLKYEYWTQIYSQETDKFLTKFHNNVDRSGIDVRIWNQTLLTPVCLRDFARFIMHEKREWLKMNRDQEFPEGSESEAFQEECEGLKGLKIAEMYQDYAYLLPVNLEAIERRQKSFQTLIEELVTYPGSNSLAEFCSKMTQEPHFLAYNLGAARVQLTGATVVFHSADGVKVTVDSSRFLDQKIGASVKILADDHLLVAHSKRDQFHFVLADGTIVLFTKSVMVEKKPQDFLTLLNDYLGDRSEAEDSESRSSLLDNVKENFDLSKIPIKFSPSFGAILKGNPKNLIEILRLVLLEQISLYKPPKKTRLLKRRTSEIYVPLHGIINRVLFKAVSKKRRRPKIKGYHIYEKGGKNISGHDLTLTLPNGLCLETLKTGLELVEVQQSYRYSNFKDEQYRIYFKSGSILIKKFDGSIQILRATGDIIELSDEASVIESGDRVEAMAKLLRQFNEIKVPVDNLTRRTHCDKVPGTIQLMEFGSIPYPRKTLISLDGEVITEVNGEIVTEKAHYAIDTYDYQKEETFLSRDDGLRIFTDKKGKKIIEFPDSTKISTWYEIEKDLVFIEDSFGEEGWLSVAICYRIEHPDYITVTFNGIEKNTGIHLTNNIYIRNFSGLYYVHLSDYVSVKIDSDTIDFSRQCYKCCENLHARIFTDRASKDSDLFLKVNDSYDKVFTSNYSGKCSINSDFIQGSANKSSCNHYLINDFEKFFVLNRDFTGTQLWRNVRVEEQTVNKSKQITSYFNNFVKLNTLEIFQDVRQDFQKRFTASSLHSAKLSLSRDRGEVTSPLYYVTYRILYQVLDLTNCMELEEKVMTFLANNPGVSFRLIDGINEILNQIVMDHPVKSHSLLSLRRISNKDPSMDGKPWENVGTLIKKWREECDKYKKLIRNRKFPSYFQSDYYRELSSNCNK